MKFLTYSLLLFVSTCLAQDNTTPNAQPRVAPALQECYRRREIFERDNRLPMTPNMLIELIRKVEDSPGFTLNIQQLTTSILHRFKQDGIIRELWIVLRYLAVFFINYRFSLHNLTIVYLVKRNKFSFLSR